MYHSVSGCTDDPYRITVSPHRLDRQLRWLRDHGLSGVSVGELMRARAAGRGAGLVGLTFDDGYADFAESALPLLRRHGCTATVFVLPGRLGGDNAWDELGPRKPLLTADGIRAAAAEGMEVGSHGLMHTDLTTADDATLERETKHSRACLADITGTAPQGFCYPYGTVDSRAVEAVRDAGYGYACAIDPGTLTCIHALPRVHIDASDTSVRLFLKRMLNPLRRKPLPSEPPVQHAPVRHAPVQDSPVQDSPVQESPGQDPQAEGSPAAPRAQEPRTPEAPPAAGRAAGQDEDAAGQDADAVGSETGGGR
ncbi:polysaccharide deacetylase family protein [Streptomyces sp. HNM0575]|nr:polysaccharide deacetylase family protein [Streptomyces sp. HNM0575]